MVNNDYPAGGTNYYVYDPLGYRIGSSAVGDYYLDGEHLEAVYSGSQVQAKYFRGVGTDELLAGFSYVNGRWTPAIYMQDALMSVTGISSHDGKPVWSSDYTAFGDRTIGATGASTNRLQYTGRENDGTGLYYYRARYYDPSIGRFISEDPLGFKAGINFYAYVNNNPVNGNDPSGKCPACIAYAVETAPEWGPPVLAAIRIGVNAAVNFVKTNPGLVAGTIGGVNGGAGYYATTPNPSLKDGAIATGIGVAQGVASVLLPGEGTLVQGGAIGGVGDYLQQVITDPNKSINPLEVGAALASNAVASKFLGAANVGSGWAEQAGVNTVSGPFTTGMTAIGQSLGTLPNTTPLVGDFSNPSGTSSFAAGAAGGFLLYPNKPNTNQMQSVYAKP